MGFREKSVCFCDFCNREYNEDDEDYKYNSKLKKYFCEDGCEEEYIKFSKEE